MKSICPFCQKPLKLEATAQFIDRVDAKIVDLYAEELERMKKRASIQGGLFGGMMNMAAGMAKGMQGTMLKSMEGMIKYPPLAMIVQCMSCGAALSVSLPSQNSD